MRHGTIAVLAAALLVGAFGCKKEPENQRISVEQEAPFRAEAEMVPDETTIETGEIAAGDTGTDDGVTDANTSEGSATRTYVVKRGDKGFMDIARKQLGDVHRWREIRDLNQGVDSRKLRIGQEIVIPAK